MDAVSSSTSVSQAPQQGVVDAASAQETSASTLASDFETFLALLTTQLQNQDPTKPLDSTEFVAQLASFSAVEQQINTNTKLEELIGLVNGGLASDLSAWVGTLVEAPTDAQFDGTAIDVTFSTGPDTTAAQLVVRNNAGLEIDRRPVELGSTSLSWDGKDASGATVSHGKYSFEIETVAGLEPAQTNPAYVFATVKEARVSGDDIELVFDDGSRMNASDVKAMREPS